MKKRKPFNREVWAANDAIGKKAVLQVLKSLDITADENPNPYGIDLVVRDSEDTYEVERRTIWETQWPFDTVHIPERKHKFMKPGMTYAVVNKDCDKVMMCPSETILLYPQREVKNTAVASGEYFYDVPLGEWTIYDIEEDKNG